MGRPKGGTNKTWSTQEKFAVIKPITEGTISAEQRAKDLNIKSSGIVRKWVKLYLDGGIFSLENKWKPIIPLQKYQILKELTEVEKLEYKNLKLRIENKQ